MSLRPVLGTMMIACLLAASCSGNESPEGVPGPANSVDGRLPTLNDGDELPVGKPHAFVVGTHCGVRVLGRQVNGALWITDEASEPADWFPPEWATAVDGGQELIALSIVLSPGGRELVATAEDASVRYRPVTDSDEGLDCA